MSPVPVLACCPVGVTSRECREGDVGDDQQSPTIRETELETGSVKRAGVFWTEYWKGESCTGRKDFGELQKEPLVYSVAYYLNACV